MHYSSGVANHFFYLLAEGSSPTNGQPASPTCNGQTVTGIGRDKAGKIWYKALVTYMTSNTNYKGASSVTSLPGLRPAPSRSAWSQRLRAPAGSGV